MSDNNQDISPQMVRNSRARKRAKRIAEKYAASPEKLDKLVNNATKKAKNKSDKNNQGPLKDVWTQLMACFRLLSAYSKGDYRKIPWQSLIMMIASIIYFVMPFDLLPDFLAGLGYLDDVTLLAWTLKAIGSDIDAFQQWETQRQNGDILDNE